MSPEQASGDPLDGRSDLYALGGTAFFALTGRLPFQSSTAAGFLHQHRHVEPPPVASLRPGLPPSLAAVVDRCLAKSPDERFPTAEALADALAPAVRALSPVPGAVRRVHEEARQLVADAGGALSVAAIIGLQGVAIALKLPVGLADSAGFFNGIVLAGLAVLLGARGSAVMVRVREAAREGISRAGVADAAEQLGDAEQEVHGPPASRNLL
jgi:serine/threonine-protein kinase